MKNILITGASGNLGKASVEKFLASGYRVIATVSPGKTLGYPVSDSVDVREVDLTNESMVSDAVQKVIEDYKTIDASLLLVGAYGAGSIQNTNGAALRKMIALNFETSYFTARALLEKMKQQSGGRIILIGARPALNAQEGKEAIAYALSKSLIFKLADYINAESNTTRVTASVIVPGVIDTELNRKANPSADFSQWVKPEEIAEAMLYVCSDSARPLRNAVIELYNNS